MNWNIIIIVIVLIIKRTKGNNKIYMLNILLLI